jgi:hypothetical protein
MPAVKSPKKSLRAKAMSLVRTLPRNASWDDLMYRIYVRQKIESGLTDLKGGKIHSHAAIRAEFGVNS